MIAKIVACELDKTHFRDFKKNKNIDRHWPPALFIAALFHFVTTKHNTLALLALTRDMRSHIKPSPIENDKQNWFEPQISNRGYYKSMV